MQTLSELKHLERVCIIAREGTMKMYSQAVVSLFEKVSKLNYVLLFGLFVGFFVLYLLLCVFAFCKLWTTEKKCQKINQLNMTHKIIQHA